MTSAWDSKKLQRFLNAVQERPFLWDSTHEASTNYTLKAEQWNLIGCEFGISGFMAQYTFKKLRGLAQKKHINNGGRMDETGAWSGLKYKCFLDGVDLRGENTKMKTIREEGSSKLESGIDSSNETAL